PDGALAHAGHGPNRVAGLAAGRRWRNHTWSPTTASWPGARHEVLAQLCLFQRRLRTVEKRIVEILADPAVDIHDEVRGYLALFGDHLQQDAGRRHIETRIGQLDRAERVYHDGLRFGVVHLFGYQFRSFLLGIRLDEVDPAQCRPHEANDQIG